MSTLRCSVNLRLETSAAKNLAPLRPAQAGRRSTAQSAAVAQSSRQDSATSPSALQEQPSLPRRLLSSAAAAALSACLVVSPTEAGDTMRPVLAAEPFLTATGAWNMGFFHRRVLVNALHRSGGRECLVIDSGVAVRASAPCRLPVGHACMRRSLPLETPQYALRPPVCPHANFTCAKHDMSCHATQIISQNARLHCVCVLDGRDGLAVKRAFCAGYRNYRALFHAPRLSEGIAASLERVVEYLGRQCAVKEVR